MSQVTNTFNNIIVISRQFCRWREPEYMEKTNDLQTVANTFNSIQVTMWQLALCSYILVVEQEYPDTKWAIRNRISKNRQHNGQKKKYKRWKSAECQEKTYYRPQVTNIILKLYYIGGDQSTSRKPPTCRRSQTLSTTLWLYRDSCVSDKIISPKDWYNEINPCKTKMYGVRF